MREHGLAVGCRLVQSNSACKWGSRQGVARGWGVCCRSGMSAAVLGCSSTIQEGSREASHRRSRCAICRGLDADQKRELGAAPKSRREANVLELVCRPCMERKKQLAMQEKART